MRVVGVAERAAVRGGPAALRGWAALAVLICVSVLGFVDRQILAIVAAPLSQSLALTDLQLGMLQGFGLALFSTTATFPLAWLADRFDRRKVLAISIVAWTASTCACAFASSYEEILIASIGIAVGEAGLNPILLAMLADLFPGAQRVRANLVFFVAAVFGIAIGIGAGSFALSAFSDPGLRAVLPAGDFEPWRGALVAVAVPGPLLALLVLALPAGRSAAVADASAGFGRYLHQARRVLPGLFGSQILANAAIVTAIAWLPVALPRRFGIAPEDAGYRLSLALGIAALVGVFGTALLVRRWRGDALQLPLRLGFVAFLVAIVPASFLPLVASPNQAVAIVLLQFAVGSAALSILPTVLQNITPPQFRARAMSIFTILFSLSQGLSQILVGALSSSALAAGDVLAAMAIFCVPAWLVAALAIAAIRRALVQLVAQHGSYEGN